MYVYANDMCLNRSQVSKTTRIRRIKSSSKIYIYIQIATRQQADTKKEGIQATSGHNNRFNTSCFQKATHTNQRALMYASRKAYNKPSDKDVNV